MPLASAYCADAATLQDWGKPAQIGHDSGTESSALGDCARLSPAKLASSVSALQYKGGTEASGAKMIAESGMRKTKLQEQDRYVVTFFKTVITDYGDDREITQRTIEVSATDQNDALDRAKEELCRLDEIGHWSHHADRYEIVAVPSETVEGQPV